MVSEGVRDHSAEGGATLAPGGRKPRKAMWIVGSVLWIAAIAAVLFNRYLLPPEVPVAGTPDPNLAVRPLEIEAGSDVVIDPTQLRGAGITLKSSNIWDPEGIADFQFTDQQGRVVTKDTLRGRPWAISFIFTKCLGPCPRVTQQMRELADRLKNHDCRFVTLTVDPKRDTQEVLASYAKNYGADPERWLFLTGDRDEIYQLVRGSFRTVVEEDTRPEKVEGFEIAHSTNIFILNDQGVVQGKYNAAKDEEMASLRRDLLKQCRAANEAAEVTPES